MAPLLSVRDLRVEFSAPDRRSIHALNGVSLEMQPGEALGLLGESGSGKSTLGKSLLRILPSKARATSGAIEFEGRDLLRCSARDLQKIRGARISRIPQEPGLALSPVMRVGDQIAEVIHAHQDRGRDQSSGWKASCTAASALLERVNLRGTPARRIYDAYPHQLSGGQLQRVVIAQAIACGPALVIADEPTASLDPGTEAEILDSLRSLRAEKNLAILFITHDPRILGNFAAAQVVFLRIESLLDERPLGAKKNETRTWCSSEDAGAEHRTHAARIVQHDVESVVDQLARALQRIAP